MLPTLWLTLTSGIRVVVIHCAVPAVINHKKIGLRMIKRLIAVETTSDLLDNFRLASVHSMTTF
jgi:hypothetical protein